MRVCVRVCGGGGSGGGAWMRVFDELDCDLEAELQPDVGGYAPVQHSTAQRMGDGCTHLNKPEGQVRVNPSHPQRHPHVPKAKHAIPWHPTPPGPGPGVESRILVLEASLRPWVWTTPPCQPVAH